MSIPASQIVTINPSLLTAGGTDLEFNGLFLTESSVIPSSQLVLPFSSASEVGEYFGTDSYEYNAARVYFLGYDNSYAKPRCIYFASRVSEDTAAWIRGASFDTIASKTLLALKEITDGDLTITLGSYTGTVSGLDFSGASSLSEIAEILQTAINAVTDGGDSWTSATVAYSSQFAAFIITSGATGEEEGVSYATGTVAEAMLLTEDDGAVLSPGLSAMDVAENMDAILELTRNFVCFSTIEQVDEDDALAYAEWAAGQGVNYLYIYWDTDENLTVSGSTDTIAAALTEANAGSTCGVYGDSLYAAFIMGTAASIDWNRRQGTITFAFKAQDGLAANVTDGTTSQVLIAANMNFMGDYATRNDNFIQLYPGCMWGDWTWIDTYLNAVWLNNALQVAIMTGFQNTPRVPYNQRGYTLVRSWCMDPINRALYNGVIDTGVTLSQSQKAELISEAGSDITGTLKTDGYVLKIGYDDSDDSDDSTEASVRQARTTPEAWLVYSYGGSIHELTIASQAIV